MNRRTLSRIGLGCIAAIAVATILAVRQTESRQDDTPRLQAHARASGGLETAARVTGKYVTSETVYRGNPVSLYQLWSFSHVVAIAEAIANRGFLTANGDSIVTAFEFRVESVLKGAGIDDSFAVVIPGGRVGFEGGHWAQVNVPNYSRPQRGKQYVLFLRHTDRSAVRGEIRTRALFEPSFGALGLYDITEPDGIVTPLGASDTSFANELVRSKMKVQHFLSQVQSFAAPR